MRFVRQQSYLLSCLVLLVFCLFMVKRQFRLNEARHVEIREAFILLQAKGYDKECRRLYRHLIETLPALPTSSLFDDYQRTLQLVDPGKHQTENMLWRYHASVSRELETRSEQNLARALKLADQYQP